MTYWVDQKFRSGFSIRWYEKSIMNLLANPTVSLLTVGETEAHGNQVTWPESHSSRVTGDPGTRGGGGIWLQSPPPSLYQKLRLLHCFFFSGQMSVYNRTDACLEYFGLVCGVTAVTRFPVPIHFPKKNTRYSWFNPCPGFCMIRAPCILSFWAIHSYHV